MLLCAAHADKVGIESSPTNFNRIVSEDVAQGTQTIRSIEAENTLKIRLRG